MAKSPAEQLDSMIKNLSEKTGKSMEQWLAIVKPMKFAKHGEIMKFLKEDQGVSHGYANLIALTAMGSVIAPDEGEAEDLVQAQYAGAMSGLKPIYDALIKAIQSFGSDVEVAPKKAYVSVRRSKQFTILQPSTATRLDVGLNLKGEKSTDRLEASGSFNAMVSHRVRVSKAEEVDKQLIGWLKQAYEKA